MARQLLTLGGANFTPFAGFDHAYSTNYTPNNTDLSSNFTGAISPATGAGRPLLVSSLTVKFRSGGGGGNLFCSTDATATGTVTSISSSVNSFSGDVSRVLDYPALIDDELYYGFDKTDTIQTDFSSDTLSGSNIYSNGSVLFSNRAMFAELQFDTLPNAVTNLSASPGDGTDLDVSWTAPSDDGGTSITGYQIAYRPSSGGTWQFDSSSGTSHTISNLSGGTEYEIVVGAKNAVSAKHNSQFGYTGEQAHTGTSASTTATPLDKPVFTDTTLEDATQGVSYSDEVDATNATSYTLISGMPSGLGLNTNNGDVTGTPTQSGSFTVTIDANNSSGSTRAFVPLTVNPPAPVWVDQTLASTAVLDSQYNDGVNAEYATGYSVSAGSLPPGISLNTSTGSVTGTPTQEGVFDGTIQASNVTGTISTAFEITVTSGLAPPTFTDDTLDGDLRVGIAYSDSVLATDADTYEFIGTQPTGLTIDNSGNVTGTPEAQGEFSFDIRATNAAGSADAPFTLDVKPGGERFDGTDFQRIETLKRYDGTGFVDVQFVKRFDGTDWVDANL